jgi:hypothetical protein
MNKPRREFLIWATLLSLGMTGCFTLGLHERIKYDASYAEEVTSVLMTEDGKKLVFIGDKYHYIFDAPVGLLYSLSSSFRKSLFASFKEFRVDINDRITGNVTISLDESASQEDKDAAIESGFDQRPASPVLEFSLQGKRYYAGGVATDRVGYKLNYNYKVGVLEERSSLEKAALTAMTPITVAADGVLILVGVPLVVLLQVSPN